MEAKTRRCRLVEVRRFHGFAHIVAQFFRGVGLRDDAFAQRLGDKFVYTNEASAFSSTRLHPRRRRVGRGLCEPQCRDRIGRFSPLRSGSKIASGCEMFDRFGPTETRAPVELLGYRSGLIILSIMAPPYMKRWSLLHDPPSILIGRSPRAVVVVGESRT
jgi:hypothetical protein